MANHLTEFQMNHYFGWIQGSGMPSTYVHLSGKDLDGAILKLNGIEQKQDSVVETKPRVCPRCETINRVDSAYCNKCAAILDEKTLLQSQRQHLETQQATTNAHDLMNALMQDTEVRTFLAQRILAMGLKEKLLCKEGT
ncbi:hypothetical protein HY641_02200 [Candidatus Woesearchaeota archaeon]|nr:hypothetical protein [Candidatus Woesearchaeota archaeon]